MGCRFGRSSATFLKRDLRHAQCGGTRNEHEDPAVLLASALSREINLTSLTKTQEGVAAQRPSSRVHHVSLSKSFLERALAAKWHFRREGDRETREWKGPATEQGPTGTRLDRTRAVSCGVSRWIRESSMSTMFSYPMLRMLLRINIPRIDISRDPNSTFLSSRARLSFGETSSRRTTLSESRRRTIVRNYRLAAMIIFGVTLRKS